eukprot:1462548-Pleurochrysis_carterae.AAC.1
MRPCFAGGRAVHQRHVFLEARLCVGQCRARRLGARARDLLGKDVDDGRERGGAPRLQRWRTCSRQRLLECAVVLRCSR